ncbi:transposase InsO family protein [Luteibacter rhizovicinus]|uniref:Transposase InsO family protein n=2 Tax=Luteibacter rhizovicinus TaxID=242606 RepID=A0A4R3YFR7_9GAMM|nr:transposase InsO family protein [Luteibacter rhizovicinus]
MSVAELARRFGVCRTTAYKWLRRSQEDDSVADRSRRPHRSPGRTDSALEAAVIAVRQAHRRWGGRKIRQVLLNAGHATVPACSTITDILRRHDLIDPADSVASTPWKRFEHAAPNDLWQMDFKGTIKVGPRDCDPLTVLDDHSRFNIALRATPDMTGKTVQKALSEAFRIYGMPWRMNMDNGSPWGIANGVSSNLSAFAIWLIQLGIRVSFSAPHHPQTNGKDERFHRSLKAELLSQERFVSLRQAQRAFDLWRQIYNTVRPHQGIGMAVPADRYQPSLRSFPQVLPELQYPPADTVTRVRGHGRLYFKGTCTTLSMALSNHHVALRARDAQDGIYDVYFGHHHLTVIDLHQEP